MNEPSPTGRRPWVALVLSLFSTGLGHLYCGRIGTGLAFFFGFLLVAPLAVLIAWFGASTAALLALIVPFAFRTDLLMVCGLTTLTLMTVAAWESISRRRSGAGRH